MKNNIVFSITVSVLVLFSAILCAACQPLDGAQIIGPGGGAVFYDKGSYSGGWRYVECAPKDAGKLYLDTSGNIDFLKAAEVAEKFSYGGFKDWQLPTDSEFEAIFKNLMDDGSNKNNDNATGFMGLEIGNTKYYITNASVYHLGANGIERGSSYYSGSNTYRIRPVRRF